MKILVCIKQIPVADQMKFDATSRRLIREGVGNEINPFDRRAISQAVALRAQFGGEVIVITMGPPQAKEALVEALAMGCDRAVHLLGREFAGADTLATARTLALACKKIGVDLILCGKCSTDAGTAQVPPMLAELLDLPQVTGVTGLEFSENGSHFSARRELDDGFEIIESATPAVLGVAERLIKPVRVVAGDLEAARQKPIEVWGAASLSNDVSGFGLAGSSTEVSEVYSIEPHRKYVIRTLDGNLDVAVRDTVRDLLNEGLFGKWRNVPTTLIRPRKTSGSKERAIWVFTELVDGKIRPISLELLGRGIELAEKIDGELAAVLIGREVAHHAHTLAAFGAEKVYLADAPDLATYSTEGFAAVLAHAIRRHSPYILLIPSTANGRDLAPRLAARLSIGLTGDCIGLEIDNQQHLVQLKPAFCGNVIAPILTKTRPVMTTIRPGILQRAEPDFSRQIVIENLPASNLGPIRTHTVSVERIASEGAELDHAEIVVGVGMGIGRAENLLLVQKLASALRAAIGATRRVVDAGWLPRQTQIGLTGRSFAPKLYIAIGISGKSNHMVGIQRAGLILAINNDPQAEVFKQCDYGIVGDWAAITPILEKVLVEAQPAR